MLQLFTPESKVQKDRKIMRETDARMAKYSRRSLVLNVGAFALCLLFGDFYHVAETLATLLAAGLLILTLWRGYYLFRFDALYPRAPARWRNRYFIASFLGAIWWSGILVSLTWTLGMESETPILWLYTVVLLSSVANVFAPYRQYLSYYLFLAQIPVAITAVMLGTVEGYMYGIMMVVLFLSLNHQGQITSKTYWERLEANYHLKQRTKDLEEENLGSQAAIDLKNELLTNLGHEFRTSLSDVLGALSLLKSSNIDTKQQELLTLAEKASERQLGLVNNVIDFSRIAAKELVLDIAVFNLRRHLEEQIQELALEAHQQGVELHYRFDADLPIRVKGDTNRLTEVLSNLVSHATKFSEQGQVLIEVEFRYDSDDAGELQVTISDYRNAVEEGAEPVSANTEFSETKRAGVGLAICKALAECMDGTVREICDEGEGRKLFLNIRLKAPIKQTQQFNIHPKLQTYRILLMDPPKPMADNLIEELESWGLAVETVNDQTRAEQRLDDASNSDHPFDLILLFAGLKDLDVLTFSRELSASPDLANLKQILAVSQLQQRDEQLQKHLESAQQVAMIGKPVLRQSLLKAINDLLFDRSNSDEERKRAFTPLTDATGKHILLVEDHRVNQMVAQGMLKKLGYTVTLAGNGREALNAMNDEAFDLILMDCQMPEMDGYMATQEIRSQESNQGEDHHIPIIAMTANAAEGDQSRCFAAGMDDYLPKPVRYEELESRLAHWLGSGG